MSKAKHKISLAVYLQAAYDRRGEAVNDFADWPKKMQERWLDRADSVLEAIEEIGFYGVSAVRAETAKEIIEILHDDFNLSNAEFCAKYPDCNPNLTVVEYLESRYQVGEQDGGKE